MIKNKIKTILMTIAILLASMLVAGFLVHLIVADNKTSTTSPTIEAEEPTTALALDDCGNQMQDGETYEMPVAMTFAAYDGEVTVVALNYVEDVTAIIEPDITNIKVDWSIAWANPDSAWVSGKIVTHYVNCIPTEYGATTATITCKYPFGEKIIITATVRDNPGISDSCTVDYIKRIAAYTDNSVFNDFGDMIYFGKQLTFSEGTTTGEFTFNKAHIALDDSYVAALKSNLNFDITVSALSITALPENGYVNFETNASNGYSWVTAETNQTLGYSAFIDNFDSLTTAQKKAVYYAWYTTWKSNFGSSGYNAYIDYQFTYSFNGTLISTINETELDFSISGESYGSGLSTEDINAIETLMV